MGLNIESRLKKLERSMLAGGSEQGEGTPLLAKRNRLALLLSLPSDLRTYNNRIIALYKIDHGLCEKEEPLPGCHDDKARQTTKRLLDALRPETAPEPESIADIPDNKLDALRKRYPRIPEE